MVLSPTLEYKISCVHLVAIGYHSQFGVNMVYYWLLKRPLRLWKSMRLHNNWLLWPPVPLLRNLCIGMTISCHGIAFYSTFDTMVHRDNNWLLWFQVLLLRRWCIEIITMACNASLMSIVYRDNNWLLWLPILLFCYNSFQSYLLENCAFG